MIKGKAWKYGDDVDTDVIIPARHLTTSDPDQLKGHCMEDLDPEFASKVSAGDVLVAGRNFGCGSSREHAPVAIKAAGVSCVIAASFARIFYRNSINIGLPILECAEAAEGIETGDEIEADLAAGRIRNLTKGAEYAAAPLPEFIRELVEEGGLMAHVRKLIAEGGVSPGGEEGKEPEQEEEKKEPGARMKELEEESEKGKAAPWVEDEESEAPSPEDELERGEEEEEEEEDEE